MHYTESEKDFWKYHTMGCGYRGEFTQKQQYPGDPIIFECPECGSEYRPEQEHKGELWTFAGDSVDMLRRVSDEELIEELKMRGIIDEAAIIKDLYIMALVMYSHPNDDVFEGRYHGAVEIALHVLPKGKIDEMELKAAHTAEEEKKNKD